MQNAGVASKSSFSDCQLPGGAQKFAIRMPAFVVTIVCIIILPSRCRWGNISTMRLSNGSPLEWNSVNLGQPSVGQNRAPVEGVKLHNWSDFVYCKMHISEISEDKYLLHIWNLGRPVSTYSSLVYAGKVHQSRPSLCKDILSFVLKLSDIGMPKQPTQWKAGPGWLVHQQHKIPYKLVT